MKTVIVATSLPTNDVFANSFRQKTIHFINVLYALVRVFTACRVYVYCELSTFTVASTANCLFLRSPSLSLFLISLSSLSRNLFVFSIVFYLVFYTELYVVVTFFYPMLTFWDTLTSQAWKFDYIYFPLIQKLQNLRGNCTLNVYGTIRRILM